MAPLLAHHMHATLRRCPQSARSGSSSRPRSTVTSTLLRSPLLRTAALSCFVLLLLSCCALPLRAQSGGGGLIGGGEGPGTVPGGGEGPGGNGGNAGGGEAPSLIPRLPITKHNPDSAGGPTARGDTFPVWAIIVCSVAGGVVLLFFCMKWQNPRGTAFDVVIFFLAIGDFASDVWFIYTIRDNESFTLIFKLAIAFTAVPFVLNFFVLMRMIWGEMSSNLAFRRWLNFNFAPFTAVVLTSCTSLDAMFILDSHVCGIPCLQAPWSEKFITFLRMAGLVTILFEDIPQAALQIYVIATSSYQLVNIVTLCSSLVTITFGITKRILVCCVYQFDARDADLEMAKGQASTDQQGEFVKGGNDASNGAYPAKNIVALHDDDDDMDGNNNDGDGVQHVQQFHPVVVQTNGFGTAPPGGFVGTVGNGNSLEPSRVLYHTNPTAPPSAVPTPESRIRRLGPGGVSAFEAAQHVAQQEQEQQLGHEEQFTYNYSPASSTKQQPMSDSGAGQSHTSHAQPAVTAAVAGATDVPSPRPPLPPRPYSPHNSPLAQKRSIAGAAAASGAGVTLQQQQQPTSNASLPVPSSHAQQSANYYSPQLQSRRSTQPSHLQAPDLSPAPHSARRASASPAHDVGGRSPSGSPAPLAVAHGDRPPAYTVSSADSLPDTRFNTFKVQKGPMQPVEGQPPTLADLLRGNKSPAAGAGNPMARTPVAGPAH